MSGSPSLPVRRRVRAIKISPEKFVKFNLAATVVWICLILPTMLWWRESILWIAMMSIWANIVGHYSAYAAARAERETHDQESTDKGKGS